MNKNNRLCSSMTACGQNNVSRIVGGYEAEPHSWPWMAAIFIKIDSNRYKFCGGSVISNWHVLSAAHCAFDKKGLAIRAQNFRIMLGAHNRTAQDGVWYDVSRVIAHPEYESRTRQSDISLLTLERRIVFSHTIAPLCLADDSVSKINLTRYHAVVTGWGDMESGSQAGSSVLREVRLPIVSEQKCRDVYGEDRVTELNICAGFEEGGKDSCQGDSGGPLSVNFNHSWTEVGIVSFGEECALPGKYS